MIAPHVKAIMDQISALTEEEQDNISAHLKMLELERDEDFMEDFMDMLSIRLNANNAPKIEALKAQAK